MKLYMYAIRDSKAEAYAQPFFMQNDQIAVRAFMATIEDPNSKCNKYPNDFSLYRIGDWDDNTGGLTCPLEPKFLYSAVDLFPLIEQQRKQRYEISNDPSVLESSED